MNQSRSSRSSSLKQYRGSGGGFIAPAADPPRGREQLRMWEGRSAVSHGKVGNAREDGAEQDRRLEITSGPPSPSSSPRSPVLNSDHSRGGISPCSSSFNKKNSGPFAGERRCLAVTDAAGPGEIDSSNKAGHAAAAAATNVASSVCRVYSSGCSRGVNKEESEGGGGGTCGWERPRKGRASSGGGEDYLEAEAGCFHQSRYDGQERGAPRGAAHSAVEGADSSKAKTPAAEVRLPAPRAELRCEIVEPKRGVPGEGQSCGTPGDVVGLDKACKHPPPTAVGVSDRSDAESVSAVGGTPSDSDSSTGNKAPARQSPHHSGGDRWTALEVAIPRFKSGISNGVRKSSAATTIPNSRATAVPLKRNSADTGVSCVTPPSMKKSRGPSSQLDDNSGQYHLAPAACKGGQCNASSGYKRREPCPSDRQAAGADATSRESFEPTSENCATRNRGNGPSKDAAADARIQDGVISSEKPLQDGDGMVARVSEEVKDVEATATIVESPQRGNAACEDPKPETTSIFRCEQTTLCQQQPLDSSQSPYAAPREIEERDAHPNGSGGEYVEGVLGLAGKGRLEGGRTTLVKTSTPPSVVGDGVDSSPSGEMNGVDLGLAVPVAVPLTEKTVESMAEGRPIIPGVPGAMINKTEGPKVDKIVDVSIGKSGETVYRFNASARSRRGKWSRLEEEYAKRIITDFDEGVLDAPPGVGLRLLLASKINCEVMRVSKKFCGWACVGKRSFRPVHYPDGRTSRAQASLYALEQSWLRTFIPSSKRTAETPVNILPISSKACPSSSSPPGSPVLRKSLMRLVPAPPAVERDGGLSSLRKQTTPAQTWLDRAKKALAVDASVDTMDSLVKEGQRYCSSTTRQITSEGLDEEERRDYTEENHPNEIVLPGLQEEKRESTQQPYTAGFSRRYHPIAPAPPSVPRNLPYTQTATCDNDDDEVLQCWVAPRCDKVHIDKAQKEDRLHAEHNHVRGEERAQSRPPIDDGYVTNAKLNSNTAPPLSSYSKSWSGCGDRASVDSQEAISSREWGASNPPQEPHSPHQQEYQSEDRPPFGHHRRERDVDNFRRSQSPSNVRSPWRLSREKQHGIGGRGSSPEDEASEEPLYPVYCKRQVGRENLAPAVDRLTTEKSKTDNNGRGPSGGRWAGPPQTSSGTSDSSACGDPSAPRSHQPRSPSTISRQNKNAPARSPYYGSDRSSELKKRPHVGSGREDTLAYLRGQPPVSRYEDEHRSWWHRESISRRESHYLENGSSYTSHGTNRPESFRIKPPTPLPLHLRVEHTGEAFFPGDPQRVGRMPDQWHSPEQLHETGSLAAPVGPTQQRSSSRFVTEERMGGANDPTDSRRSAKYPRQDRSFLRGSDEGGDRPGEINYSSRYPQQLQQSDTFPVGEMTTSRDLVRYAPRGYNTTSEEEYQTSLKSPREGRRISGAATPRNRCFRMLPPSPSINRRRETSSGTA